MMVLYHKLRSVVKGVRLEKTLSKKIKKITYPPLQPPQNYGIIPAVDHEEGFASAIPIDWQAESRIKKEENKMFALKQNKLMKLSDKCWQHSSFCLNSIECLQSYREDSVYAGPRTF